MPKHRPPEDAQIWESRQRHQRTKPWHYKKRAENHRHKAANPYRQELTLADLESERLFIRNHRGGFTYTGESDFQFTDEDFP